MIQTLLWLISNVHYAHHHHRYYHPHRPLPGKACQQIVPTNIHKFQPCPDKNNVFTLLDVT